jgi:hypothetical protein
MKKNQVIKITLPVWEPQRPVLISLAKDGWCPFVGWMDEKGDYKIALSRPEREYVLVVNGKGQVKHENFT